MKKFIYFVAAAIVAVACSKTYIGPKTTIVVTNGFIPYYGWNIPTNENGEAGIFFGNYVPATKATSENGRFVGPNECGYDSFSMFAFKDGVAVMNPYTVAWNGSMWSYETNTQELQYFDRNSEKYDFIGVIADNATNDNGVIKVNAEAFMDNSNEMDTPKEVLYSITSVDKSGYNAPVSINFQHVNAKMYIGFASDRADTKIIDYAPGSTITVYDKIVQGPRTNTVSSNYKYGQNAPWFSGNGSAQEIADAVNAQWNYFEDSTGTINASDTDWRTGENKPYVQLKPEYYNNDVFMTLANDDLKTLCKPIMDAGYRVCRIDDKPGSNEWEIFFVYLNNLARTTTGNGLPGIRVFSVATSEDKLVRTNHTTEALVSIKNTCELAVTESSIDSLEFAIPSSNVAQFATKDDVVVNDVTFSPSVYYTLPVNNPASGYVVKFSYTYDGTNYYDARVNIPFEDSDFKQGYYYKFIIYITDHTNGGTDPDKANDKKDDVDMTEYPVNLNVHITKYESGKEVVYQL